MVDGKSVKVLSSKYLDILLHKYPIQEHILCQSVVLYGSQVPIQDVQMQMYLSIYTGLSCDIIGNTE